MIQLSFTEDDEVLKKRDECLRFLREHTVNVGLTSSASGRSRMLLAIHEHGAPVMRIPPRPVVKPALSQAAVREEMAACQVEALQAAQAGDMAGTVSGLERSGQAGADGIRAYIDKGIPPPNAPVTISGGWIRNRVSGKPVKVEGKSGTTPLVDTGQLRADFDWEITER